MLRQPLQRFAKLLAVSSSTAAVAHRHRDISKEPRVLGATHRALSKHRAKFRLRQPRAFLQRWRCVLCNERVGYGRARIPGTHVLANVASEYVLPHGGAMLFRNGAAQLDCEIRDTAGRIDSPMVMWRSPMRCGRRHECIRRARINTSRTRPATIRRRRIRRDREGRYDFAQKKPRPQRLINQAGIFSDPSEPSEPREAAFQNRRRIHADLVVEPATLAVGNFTQPACDALQTCANHVVIIRAPGVARDDRLPRLLKMGTDYSVPNRYNLIPGKNSIVDRAVCPHFQGLIQTLVV